MHVEAESRTAITRDKGMQEEVDTAEGKSFIQAGGYFWSSSAQHMKYRSKPNNSQDSSQQI